MRKTLGPQVGKVMAALGQPPTPWQQHVLDVALEVEPFDVIVDGVLIRTEWRFFYREIRLWVPRQSGKTSLLLGVMLHRCLTWPDQRVLYTAQTRNKAREKFVDEHLEILKLSRFAKFYTERLTNGSEQLKFRKQRDRPSTWGIDATTEKSSHGPTTDLVIADEFFAQVDDRVEEGARPTMVARPQPQIWFVSTFGDDKDGAAMGGPLLVKVDDSRNRCRRYDAGDLNAHGRVCSFEWSAADVDNDDIDYGDVELWRRTMPALECNGGIIREEAIHAEFDNPNIAPFKRAYLNLRRRKNEVVRMIPLDKWTDAAILSKPARKRSIEGLPVAFSLDLSPDNDEAAISFAGRRKDGRMHGEVIASAAGTSWVVDRLVLAVVRAGPQFAALGYVPGSTAAALIPDILVALKRAGVDMGEGPTSKLIKITGQDYAAACGALYTSIIDGQFRHIDQEWLNTAVAGCKKRTSGASWIWDRKQWTTNITPLCSVTSAIRAFQMAPVKKKKPVFAA